MIKFALRGLLGRKLRTVLTALGVVLGVALVAGTYVLTDSISTAFDSIFKETYKNTDAAITGKSAFSLGDNAELPRRPSTSHCSQRSLPCPTCARPRARSAGMLT